MAQPRNGRPVVSTYSDHKIITPINKLAKARATVSLPGDDPVLRAEAALANLANDFPAWMAQECERLDAARNALKQDGISKQGLEELFFAAHDVKGDAATFGYPLAAPAAESLCQVLEHSPAPERIPLTLIEQHVDAVRAIVRECARPDIGDIAKALTSRLRQVTQEFLIHENRHRPGYLDGVIAQNGT